MSPVGSSVRGSARQLIFYVAFGLFQLGIDWAVFACLTVAGLTVPLANLSSRLIAAITGYILNGMVTFKGGNQSKLSSQALIRFLLLWVVLTSVSTALMYAIKMHFSLDAARLTKPAVEAFLAIVSFLTMKLWVYR